MGINETNQYYIDNKPTFSLEKGSQGWIWSDQEIQLLNDKAGSISISDIADLLNRPKRAIICKASSLKIQITDKKKWTKIDDEKLSKYAGIEDLDALSHRLNRSKSSVMSRASKLKLSTSKIHKRWTEEEKEYIKINEGKLSAQIISKKLGRSKVSVQSMASIMNISLNLFQNRWTGIELSLLKSMDKKISFEKAQRQLNRKTSDSIYTKAKKLNISFLPMEENYIIEVNEKIITDAITIYNLHKELNKEGFPVGNYQSNWIKSPFFKEVVDITKLEKIKIFVTNGSTNSRPHESYLLSRQQEEKIKSYYSSLREKSIIKSEGMRSTELFHYLKNEGLIQSIYHSSFINLKLFQSYIYEENISQIQYIYIDPNHKWILTNGYFFTESQILSFTNILREYQLREKNPGSAKLRSLQTRVRKKYGKQSMNHLYSNGNSSMVYFIENHALLNKTTGIPKSYVGVWKSTNSEEYVCSGIRVYQDILKYGPQNFTKRILYLNVDYKKVLIKEIFYINKYKTNEKQRSHNGHWGYNQTDGGQTASFTSPIVVYDYFKKDEKIYKSMIDAELDLNLPQFSLSSNINRNKRKSGIPYLLDNKYIVLNFKDKHLLNKKITLLEDNGRINIALSVVSICPFTMDIIKKYENSNSASKDIKGNSSLAGDIRHVCNGTGFAMVAKSFWIYYKDLSNIKNKFNLFHERRKQKMVKRIDTRTDETKYYYSIGEAAKDNATNFHLIKNRMNNANLYINRYIFEYIIIT